MARKMSAKQIAIFGTKAQKAALRRRRSGGVRRSRSSAAPRRAPKRSTHMARKRSRGSRGKSKKSLAETGLAINAGIQLAEPFLPAAQAAMNGDVPGAIAAAKPALKEAVSFKNIGQIAGPFYALKAGKKIASMLGLGAGPRIGKRRLF